MPPCLRSQRALFLLDQGGPMWGIISFQKGLFLSEEIFPLKIGILNWKPLSLNNTNYIKLNPGERKLPYFGCKSAYWILDDDEDRYIAEAYLEPSSRSTIELFCEYRRPKVVNYFRKKIFIVDVWLGPKHPLRWQWKW